MIDRLLLVIKFWRKYKFYYIYSQSKENAQIVEPKQKSRSHSTGGGVGRVTFHSITDFQKPRLVHPTPILEMKRPGLGEDSLSQQPQSDMEARIAANLRPPSSAMWCHVGYGVTPLVPLLGTHT